MGIFDRFKKRTSRRTTDEQLEADLWKTEGSGRVTRQSLKAQRMIPGENALKFHELSDPRLGPDLRLNGASR